MSHVNHDSLLCDKVNEECPQCHHPELEYYTKHSYVADEGLTVLYECPQCRDTSFQSTHSGTFCFHFGYKQFSSLYILSLCTI
ncbi:hypothetical protein MUK42_32970 [Musa troglodytarum]|uniref:TFIIS-type domain-containing protein n=1 Tax=Musa troglodytarum TaxID=320322 RepID=A0A9E7L2B3_9LILI|nr:hypothetical protein MUK42_32970 [Musa troglodytarum]